MACELQLRELDLLLWSWRGSEQSIWACVNRLHRLTRLQRLDTQVNVLEAKSGCGPGSRIRDAGHLALFDSWATFVAVVRTKLIRVPQKAKRRAAFFRTALLLQSHTNSGKFHETDSVAEWQPLVEVWKKDLSAAQQHALEAEIPRQKILRRHATYCTNRAKHNRVANSPRPCPSLASVPSLVG